VVSRDDHKLLGMVTRYDLLNMYAHDFDEEHLRERFFRNPGKRG
jgi:hypothetical protein